MEPAAQLPNLSCRLFTEHACDRSGLSLVPAADLDIHFLSDALASECVLLFWLRWLDLHFCTFGYPPRMVRKTLAGRLAGVWNFVPTHMAHKMAAICVDRHACF